MALMMCELSSHLASSLCVSLHTLAEAPLSPSTGLQPQLLRPSCFCKMELVGLREQEAASANALALNTPMLTHTHTHSVTQPKAERTRWASGPARGQVNLPCLRQKIWGHSVCSLDILGSPATAMTSFTSSGMSLPVSTPFSLLPPSCLLGSLSPRQAQTHPGLRLCMQGAPPRQMPSL